MPRPDIYDRRISINKANMLNLFIGLGTTCNFACDYCPPWVHDGKLPWVDIDKLMPCLEQIRYQYRWKRERVYHLLGGDPILMPRVVELCARIKDMDDGSTILIATNGSRTPRFWRDFSPHIDRMIVSWHVRQADAETFNENFRIAVENGVHVAINVLMDTHHWDKAVRDALWFEQHGWAHYITLKPVETMLSSNRLQDYSREQLDFIANWDVERCCSRLAACREIGQIRRLPQDDIMRFATAQGDIAETTNFQDVASDWDMLQGWHCLAIADAIDLFEDGKVRNGSVCDQRQYLGNYFESDPKTWDWQMNSIICEKNRCVCGGDFDTHKFRNKADADDHLHAIAQALEAHDRSMLSSNANHGSR